MKSQRHNVIAFGGTSGQMAERLVKGAHVFVQGELATHEYDRTIIVPTSKNKSVEHVINTALGDLSVRGGTATARRRIGALVVYHLGRTEAAHLSTAQHLSLVLF